MIHDTNDAEAIAGEGKYEDIIEKLHVSGVLSSCVENIRNKYTERLALDNFVMTEHDFEMLAVLGLYDVDTLEHSIRTFELAYRIISHPFVGPSGESVILGSLLKNSDVSVQQFLRAALFHDIGKVIIPREVLHNTLDDEEVLVRMFPEENLEEKEEYAKKKILETLYAKGIRPIDVVPLKEIFTGEKYSELLCDLEKRGFSETATLKDVIRMHEPEGRRILLSLGYSTEAELAGAHHNYQKETHQHIVDIFGTTCGVSDLIRLADVTDALRSARWYKKPLSEIEVLFVLVKDVEVGKINKELAYLWVKDQYAAFQEKKSPSEETPAFEEEVLAIEEFLRSGSRA